jgi:hypothetical protein
MGLCNNLNGVITAEPMVDAAPPIPPSMFLPMENMPDAAWISGSVIPFAALLMPRPKEPPSPIRSNAGAAKRNRNAILLFSFY